MSDVDWPRPRPESTCGANSARRLTAQRVDGGRSGAIVLSRSNTASASSGKAALPRACDGGRSSVNDAAVSVGRMSLDRATDVRGQRPESCAARNSLGAKDVGSLPQ